MQKYGFDRLGNVLVSGANRGALVGVVRVRLLQFLPAFRRAEQAHRRQPFRVVIEDRQPDILKQKHAQHEAHAPAFGVKELAAVFLMHFVHQRRVAAFADHVLHAVVVAQ